MQLRKTWKALCSSAQSWLPKYTQGIGDNKLLGPIPKELNSIAGHGHNKFYKWS